MCKSYARFIRGLFFLLLQTKSHRLRQRTTGLAYRELDSDIVYRPKNSVYAHTDEYELEKLIRLRRARRINFNCATIFFLLFSHCGIRASPSCTKKICPARAYLAYLRVFAL